MLFFPSSVLQERARDIAETIGGDALSLADLENFHPEDGMILANTTSIGMHPKVDETPLSKVSHPSIWLLPYETPVVLEVQFSHNIYNNDVSTHIMWTRFLLQVLVL